MLDALKKKFFNSSAQSEQTLEDVTQMTTDVSQTVLAANEQALAELNTRFSDSVASLTAAQATIAELSAKFESVQAQLTAANAEKQAIADKAKSAKSAARKEKIVASVGEAKSVALMAATEGLEDAQFEAVVAALSTNLEAESNTAAFKEIGIEADVDTAVEQKPAHFNKYIKEAK